MARTFDNIDDYYVALDAGELATAYGTYVPSWISPHGEITAGDSHSDCIDHLKFTSYRDAYDNGYLRMLVDTKMYGCDDTYIGINGPCATLDQADALCTLFLLRDYKEFIIDMGEREITHKSRVDAIKHLRENAQ